MTFPRSNLEVDLERGQERSPGSDELKIPRYIPLQYRFIFWSTLMLLALLGALGSLLGFEQSRAFRLQLERKGLAMAESLGALSRGALATYNYVLLEQATNQAAQSPEVLYVIVHDKEGRVAGYSRRPDLQGKQLSDPVTGRALAATRPVVHDSLATSDGEAGMEVTVPVYLPGSDLKWGVIRVGLSLATMYAQLRQMTWIIGLVGLLALLAGVTLASVTARRITQPLSHLVEATVQAAGGNLQLDIRVDTGDEVSLLAANFQTMIQEILRQRERLENQLKEILRLQQYNERLLTTMSDGLLAVDRHGNLGAINPAARRMLGLGETDPRGLNIQELFREIPELLDYLRGSLSDPAGQAQRELHTHRSSDDQIILASSSSLLDPAGVVLETITSLHDVTELKRLEVRMRQADRLAALGTLAAGMAHEIRNPLSAIKTFVQLLPRKMEKPGFLDKFNRTVPRELERINRLIEDLLELARAPRYRLREIALGGLLEQSLDLVDEEMRLASVTVERMIDVELPLVWADPDQLLKAFHNLLRNGLQAMPSGGRLTVVASTVSAPPRAEPRFRDHPGWCVVRFEDTGVGIGAETLRNVFNPFFSTKDTGTGLGLAITHKVITEHGGFVDAASEEGKGSCFAVYLPVRRAIREQG